MLPTASLTNTHSPKFSNSVAVFFHWLGNGLVYPGHWGLNQLIKSTDPIIEKRDKAMDQFPYFIELVTRPFRFALGFLVAMLSIPLAIIGQSLKVAVSYFSKEPFEYYQYTDTQQPSSDKSEIKVGTWNLAAMHSMARRFNATRPVYPRMHEAVEKILQLDANSAPDVICFQEVFTEEATQILVEGLRERYPYIIHNVGKNDIGLNSGLMIVSRYPIEDIEFQAFEHRYYDNALSQKGVLCATITLPNNVKTVITNVHLEAGGGFIKGIPLVEDLVKSPDDLDPNDVKLLQLDQARALQNQMETRAADEQASIISNFSGDCNMGFYDVNGDFINKYDEMEVFRQRYHAPGYVADTPESSLVNPRILTAEQEESVAQDNLYFCKHETTNEQGVTSKYHIVDQCLWRQNPTTSSSNQRFYQGTVTTQLINTGDISDHLLQVSTFDYEKPPKVK